MTTSQHHCQRPGCHGILRSPESIKRGTSEACDRRLRQAVAAAGEAGGFNEEQQAKALAAIRSGEVQAEDRGPCSVPSSRTEERYATDGVSCTCPAGAKRHPYRCWHLIVPIVISILTTPRRPAPTSRAMWAELDSVGATAGAYSPF